MKKVALTILLISAVGCGSGAGPGDAGPVTDGSRHDAGRPDAGREQGFTAHYFTDWATPHIHFDDGSGWTPPPGFPMRSEGGAWFRYDHPVWRGRVELVFNDGQGHWDNNAEKNYVSTVREFWIRDGSVYDHEPADVDDAGIDATSDTGNDAGTDAAIDAGEDGGPADAGDTGPDAGDVGTDGGDAGAVDAGTNPVSRNSWQILPSANGIGSILFDGDPAKAKVTAFYPHVYRQFDAAAEETPNLLYDMYFGVRANGSNVWLNTVPESAMRYLPGTGVVEVSRAVLGLHVTEYYWVTMLADAPVALAGIRLKNAGAPVAAGVSAFALGNFHVGTGADHITNERADYDPALGGFFERNASLASYYNVVFVSDGAPAAAAATTVDYNPWQVVSAGGTLTDHFTSQRDDIVLFYQKDFGDLPAGAEATYFVAWNTIKDGDKGPIAAPIAAIASGKTLDDLLAAETGGWDAWHAEASLPGGITAAEQALAEQSAAFIRMGQVREETGGKGQILASLPPGGWNIAWVRDMAYAVIGMARAGHVAEAKEALTFVFERARAGTYADPKWGIGGPYRVSVCRYLGGGAEESDLDGAGPNIEYDGFGLSLWALEEYVRASGDSAFPASHATAVFAETADILAGLADASGLIKPDSSIWELHWDDDGYQGRRHFAYTSIAAWRGLEAAEFLAGQAGRSGTTYSAAADALKAAIVSTLVDANQVLVDFPPADRSPKPPENGVNDWNIDASVIEAFNFGIIDPASAIADATLAAIDRELGGLGSGSPGFKRTNKRCPQGYGGCTQAGGAWYNDYDVREWTFVDFRALSFLRKRHDVVSQARAARLYDWILAQTGANYNEIAELYDQDTARYLGAVPMCGFGPGAFLIDLTTR